MDESEEEGMELYTHHGVLMPTSPHSSNRDDSQCSLGTISIVEYPTIGICIEWKPTTVSVVSETHDTEWAMVNTIGERPALNLTGSKGPTNMQNWLRSQIHLTNLKSFRTSRNGQELSLVEYVKSTGSTHTTQYFFQNGNADCFLNALRGCVKNVRAKQDHNLYFVLSDHSESQVLGKSFAELNLFPENTTETVWKFMRNLQHRPYETTLHAFSKLTDVLLYRPLEQTRSDSEVAELLNRSLTVDDANGLSGDEYEVIGADLQQREPVPREEPLTQEEWFSHFNELGRLPDVAKIKETIFRGGVSSGIRKEVWKYLLGYLPWNSTFSERATLQKEKGNEYYQMKLQWRSVNSGQEQRFSDFRERKSLIEKDVSRTDRALVFYSGEKNVHLQNLYDILMTYVMYNFDLGYVQGMSDLLSPILYIMRNEVDAFWCFVGFMDLVSSNFELTQAGMKQQLQQLHCLISAVDPDLAVYLDQHDSGNMFFCFRWLLVLFKREFIFSDIMRLWEVLWTGLPCPNFHLLICVAILDAEKNTLMENQYGFTEILKHINDLSLRINVNTVISEAEGIYNQLKSVPQLPDPVRRIIGMEPLEIPEEPMPSSSSTPVEPNIIVVEEEESDTETDSIFDMPEMEAGEFIQDLVLRYRRRHPNFFFGTLEEALEESCSVDRNYGCPLIVYLHHDSSPWNETFCSSLCSNTMVKYLCDNFTLWLKNITREGSLPSFIKQFTRVFGRDMGEALKELDTEKTPVFIVIMKIGPIFQIVEAIYGDLQSDEFLNKLMAVTNLYAREKLDEITRTGSWAIVDVENETLDN